MRATAAARARANLTRPPQPFLWERPRTPPRGGGPGAVEGLLRESRRAPAWLAAAESGIDPDLEERRGFVLEIVFRVADARAGGHHLPVACAGAALVAHRVLVRDRAGADIGDDL